MVLHRLSPTGVLLVAALAATACRTTSIGLPPLDDELRNDGSAGARAALQRRYELTLEDGTIRRPGVTPTVVARETHRACAEVSTPAYDDAAVLFVSASHVAQEHMLAPEVAVDRGVTRIGPGVAVATGFLSGVGLGAVLSLAAPASGSASGGGGLANAMSMGTALGISLMLPALILEKVLVEPVAHAAAAATYRDAVIAWNGDLAARIARAAGAERDAKDPAELPRPLAAPQPLASTDVGRIER